MPLGKTVSKKNTIKTSSLLDSAVPSKEMKLGPNYKLKVALAGKSGSGKTQAMSTLPGRKLGLDFDGRRHTLSGYDDIDWIDCTNPDPHSGTLWRQVEATRREIWSQVRAGTFPYDSVFEDGLTSMLKLAMSWALLLDPKTGLGGAPAQQHYLPQMNEVENHIRSMMALPVHYGLTMHIEMIEDEEMGGIHYLPKATGKMRTAIPAWFNELYYCYHRRNEDGALEYLWNTAGAGRWDFLKSSLNTLGAYWSDPIKLDFKDPPVGFQRLLKLRFGKERPSEDINNSSEKPKPEGKDSSGSPSATST